MKGFFDARLNTEEVRRPDESPSWLEADIVCAELASHECFGTETGAVGLSAVYTASGCWSGAAAEKAGTAMAAVWIRAIVG